MGKASRAKWERRLERVTLAAVSISQRDRLRGRMAAVFGLFLGALMFVLPQNIYYICGVILFCVACLAYGAFYGWGFRCNNITKLVMFVAPAISMVCLGNYRWPRLKVSPKVITLKNEMEFDSYLIRVPFLVPKGMDGKIEPRIAKNEVDSELPLEEYGYCYGNDGEEYVVAEVPVLLSHQSRRFSLIYFGGSQAKAIVKTITSTDEQPSHSPTRQAGGIIGDYRVCHMHGHIK